MPASAQQSIKKIARSVNIPKRFRGKPIDTIIKVAKAEYLKKMVKTHTTSALKNDIQKGYREYIDGQTKSLVSLIREITNSTDLQQR